MAGLDGSAAAAPLRAPVGSPPAGVVDPLALPVAAGESPRDLHASPLSLGSSSSLDAPPRSLLVSDSPGGGGSLRATTTALFVVIALAIIGFTGWRILSTNTVPEPNVIPPAPEVVEQPAAVAPDPSAESLGQIEDDPAHAQLEEPEPEQPKKPAPKPAPKPPKKDPPRTPKAPAPKPPPAATPEPAEASAPAPAGRGKLTISSIPKAQVIVDGKFIRNSPLYRFDVAAGTRVVTLIDPEGRRKTFSVPVPADGEVRRVWSFDENRFISE